MKANRRLQWTLDLASYEIVEIVDVGDAEGRFSGPKGLLLPPARPIVERGFLVKLG